MNTVDVLNIAEEREEKGESLEEIYVHYYNAWIEEHEKPREEQNLEKADEYLKIKDEVAKLIVNDILTEKGYRLIRGKKFSHWEKKEEQ